MNIALDGTTLTLVRDGLLAVRDAEGSRVTCLTGSLWITEDQRTCDVIVEAGESFVIKRPGLTLIMALEPATLRMRERPAGSWAARVAGWLHRRLAPRPSTGALA